MIRATGFSVTSESHDFIMSDKPMKIKFLFFSGILLLSHSVYSSFPPYYKCYFRKDKKLDVFDHIFEVLETESGEKYLSQKWCAGRDDLVKGYYRGGYGSKKWCEKGGHINPVKVYNENDQIIGVYQKNPFLGKDDSSEMHESFIILTLDLLSKNLYIYHADYLSKRHFHELWTVAYREDDFHIFNTSPEILKYLPEKSNPTHLALANMFSIRSCESMRYIVYPFHFFMYSIMDFIFTQLH